MSPGAPLVGGATVSFAYLEKLVAIRIFHIFCYESGPFTTWSAWAEVGRWGIVRKKMGKTP